MKVYYFTDNLGRTKGTINKNNAIAMAQGKKVLECDISEFKGHLMGSEWKRRAYGFITDILG
jgi:hypothetical protein